MKILVACEFSGIVREAFARLGHNAWSCDLLETEIPSAKHHQGDALAFLYAHKWDLVVSHPPCTYLCNSGVRWLFGGKGKVRDEARFALMYKAADFFAEFMFCDAPSVCVENPVMHCYATDYLNSSYQLNRQARQIVQPYQFGHLETKATCLYLHGLPALKPTEDVESEMRALPKNQTNLVHLCSPGPERWRMRSRTFPGIADAMAKQWGGRVKTSISFSQSIQQSNATT